MSYILFFKRDGVCIRKNPHPHARMPARPHAQNAPRSNRKLSTLNSHARTSTQNHVHTVFIKRVYCLLYNAYFTALRLLFPSEINNIKATTNNKYICFR